MSPCNAAQYMLLGADKGLFSLHVIPNNPDPVMEQVCLLEEGRGRRGDREGGRGIGREGGERGIREEGEREEGERERGIGREGGGGRGEEGGGRNRGHIVALVP